MRARIRTPAAMALGLLMGATSQVNAQAAADLFGEGTVNTDADEYGPVLTPDGETLYFTRRNNRDGNEYIVVSRLRDGGWSPPEIASFSGRFYDKEPFVSRDGRTLYFASTRPAEPGGEDEAFDIWVVRREADGWTEPRRLSDAVNSDDYDNYPSVAANGNLYFASRREGGHGRLDLYSSRLVNGEYQPAENLGPTVNSEATDADPFIAADESYLIFTSTREGTLGAGDLYISYNREGEWTAPHHLGTVVNSQDFDYTPFVSPDGAYLYFSRGWGEMYRVPTQEVGIPDTDH